MHCPLPPIDQILAEKKARTRGSTGVDRRFSLGQKWWLGQGPRRSEERYDGKRCARAEGLPVGVVAGGGEAAGARGGGESERAKEEDRTDERDVIVGSERQSHSDRRRRALVLRVEGERGTLPDGEV